MKRMWIGIGLLIVVLTGSLILWFGLGRIFRDMGNHLGRAADAAAVLDWESADAETEKALALWQKYRKIAASFTDHAPLEQMEALFDELAIHRQLGNASPYAVVCVHLSHTACAVEEALSLKWWTLL